ncbi:Mus7/MMS22 family-domain-containing protein [Plectosphaerella plurivora]|uniref:Mus7/MMS22 family-domain-containing protein n=1 Tax=Plectosphaerella plurivora TaxID=936078 RepID=A0A9P8V6H9_9PEZI|nr:Mus7/MMS22 family-domain-containing protein [Plectosphaerella plurivora]
MPHAFAAHQPEPSDKAAAQLGDIWDVPVSPRDQPNTAYDIGLQHTENDQTLLQSSPLSSLPDTDELFDSQYAAPPTRGLRTLASRSNLAGDRNASPDPLLDDAADHAQLAKPPQHKVLSPDRGDRAEQLPIQRPREPSPAVSTLDASDLVDEVFPDSTARPAAFRSLRPRKPIQQNPYLIEGAQYSKVLKDHGIRPVRMYQEEIARRGQPSREEESPDREFEDESQNTAGGDSRTGREDESPTPRISPHSSDIQAMDLSSLRNLPSSSDMSTVLSQHSNTPTIHATNPTSPVASDDEELPSIDDILRQTRKTVSKKREPPIGSLLTLKRRRRSKAPTPRVTEPQSIALQTPGNPASQSSLEQAHNRGNRHVLQRIAVDIPQRAVTPEAGPGVIDLTMEDSLGQNPTDDDISTAASDNGTRSGFESGSESGSDIVQYGQRARGVLPASHFRLDRATSQKRNRQKQLARQLARQSDGLLDSTQKRGVAVKKAVTRPSNHELTFAAGLDDESSDSDSLPALPLSRTLPAQSTFNIEHFLEKDVAHASEEDDAFGAAMQNERTTSSRPRQAFRKVGDSRHLTQSRITRHLVLADDDSLTKRPRVAQTKPRGHPKRAKAPRKRISHVPAPRLGIVDVIDSDAPDFLKIAARTATRKNGKGRSSPTRKTIFFATRKDQIDAGMRLSDWKQGRIQPRKHLPTAPKPQSISVSTPAKALLARVPSDSPRQPLTPSGATRSKSPRSQSSERGFNDPSSTVRWAPPQSRQPVIRQRRLQRKRSHARPAQFEDDSTSQPVRLAFDKQKRLLDTLYRHNNKPSATPSIATSRPAVASGTSELPALGASLPAIPRKPRPKKGTKPQRIDITLAQFVHAHDPLPAVCPDIVGTSLPDDVLSGLAPYGTQYTQHFEVFPLQEGIYFHEDTLLGSGCVDASTDVKLAQKVLYDRPGVFSSINGQTLRWSVWTDAVSSELGLLVDAISHHLTRGNQQPQIDAVASISFIWRYVQNALSVSEESQVRCFTSRFHDVMGDLLDRLDVATSEDFAQIEVVEVLSYCFAVIVSTLTICQHSVAALSNKIRMETLLARLSKELISRLFQSGIQHVVSFYEHCQSLSFRERGVRSDRVLIQAWVLLIRSLGQLRIPKLGFWDVLYSVVILPQHRTCSDARVFEKLWRGIFVLLPLCEFDNSGIVVPGSRHQLGTEGWALPQLVLKRVFELYKANNRQEANFNGYCRALVARCHYLVDQWGWLRCSGVIGTIFDFFASLNLSHLRNEEVRRSPVFLERLHLSPSLRVEEEDACFHVFLKLVAVTIKRLADQKLAKDVKNLVFRILPNHNRQYLKEHDVHQHDLAALRNHHDLFCTLFWASPPEFRPQPSQLEGLVAPVSSHKEACLISLCAWSQLARFIASKENETSFYPFFKWQTRMFQQLLYQYSSIDQDIQQQLHALSKEPGHGISQDLTRAVIASNKAATMEVLQTSVALSLDVAKHASSLELALLGGNYLQLAQVYQHFAVPTAESPWGAYRDAAAIIDALLDRVEKLLSPDGSLGSDKTSLENSIMLVDDNLSDGFFRLARRMARNDSQLSVFLGSNTRAAAVVEQTIAVAGRLAAALIRCGTMRLSQCFQPGSHCLFDDLPGHLSLHQRHYLPLFLAEVLKRGAFDLSDVHISTLQLWLECLVKPRKYFKYEDQFAVALKNHGATFVLDSVQQPTMLRSYDSNHFQLTQTLCWMRQALQDGSEEDKKKLSTQCAAALKATMKQIEVDLGAKALDEDEHILYVGFVRRIIFLFKSYGAGICTIPDFFYQVSREYSPSEQDPQLLVAQIKSYGVRLAERDNRAVPQLFSFLYHNFKQAVLNGRLSREVLMLRKGMKEEAIMAFSLEKMLPAIIQATLSKQDVFIVFDVFCEALCLRLTGSGAPRAISGAIMDSVAHLLWAINSWAESTRSSSPNQLQPEQLHLFRKMMLLLNSLQPTIECFSFLPEGDDSWVDLENGLNGVHQLAETASRYLQCQYIPSSGVVDGLGLLSGCVTDICWEKGGIGSLADVLVQDVNKTWLHNANTITFQAPVRLLLSTESPPSHGIRKPVWHVDELVWSLEEQLRRWITRWVKCKRLARTEPRF